MNDTEDSLEVVYQRVLNRLAKWRSAFAGWQLGTRSIDDPEARAVRDHREATIMLRAEVNALTTLLITKGIISEQELMQQIVVEAAILNKQYEKLFPGFTATDIGMSVDVEIGKETTKGWRP